jgi:hypothetical protein
MSQRWGARVLASKSGEGMGVPVSEEKVCAACGRRVWSDDHYCRACGIAFAGAPERVERGTSLPGFDYHFVQGLGWGLGLAVAGAIGWAIVLILLALATHGIRLTPQ